jgi:Tfp pilus assembly protein FimV
MKRLIILALTIIVVFSGWRWWQASQQTEIDAESALTASEQEPLLMPENATSAEALVLTQESVDALKAENDELESRIADLEQQSKDAQQLIELKAARLQELAEKPDAQ